MKIRILILAAILPIMAGIFSCKKEKNNSVELTPCNYSGEKNGILGIREVKILNDYPENETVPGSFITKEEDGTFVLHTNNEVGKICNFPESVKTWTIPEEGLTVTINGNILPTTFFHPLDALHSYFDLELTMLKLK